FFFQAEDGIRDFHVTGVQTCALPISCPGRCRRVSWQGDNGFDHPVSGTLLCAGRDVPGLGGRIGCGASVRRRAEEQPGGNREDDHGRPQRFSSSFSLSVAPRAASFTLPTPFCTLPSPCRASPLASCSSFPVAS